MKKKLLVLLLFTACFALTACDSENMKAAKEAMDDGNYSEAITYLEKEENLDDKGVELLEEAKANAAFEEGNYSEAIIHIIKTSDYNDSDLYKKAEQKLVKLSLKSGKSDEIVSAANADKEFCQYAIKRIKNACKSLKYNGFKILEGMKNGIEDEDVRQALDSFYEKNKLSKPKAFLFGNWKWKRDGEQKETTVEVMTYKDQQMGVVTQVGDNEKEYQIKVDDIYWSDFEFRDDKKFTCTSLCKTRDGTEVQCTTIGEMDYSNDEIKMHLTPPSPYNMDDDSAERTFERNK